MNNEEIKNGAKVLLPEVAKLNLKHLAPYLPYGLKVCIMGESINDKPIIFELVGLDTHYAEYHEIGRTITEQAIFSDCFPMLRPMTDRLKEIELNGDKIIFEDWINESSCPDELCQYMYCMNKRLSDGNKINLHYLSYRIMSELLKYHFDVFGLIDKGLAIDINTLILTNGK